jgi:hypothetical protein
MSAMKTKISLVFLGALALMVGCVSTVNDQHAFALSPGKDSYESRYERSVDLVYGASLEVLNRLGIVGRESIINPGPTQVKSIEAKVNGRKVFVRVQPVDKTVTSVIVQVRTVGGGTDQTLTADIQKQIGIALASR